MTVRQEEVVSDKGQVGVLFDSALLRWSAWAYESKHEREREREREREKQR